MPTATTKKVTKAKLKKLASESIIDPRDNLFMQTILDMNDPTYCEQRCIELLRENVNLSVGTERAIKNRQAIINLLLVAEALRGA